MDDSKFIEKEAILEKAAEIFSRFGYQKTSTSDIARAMGKTKSYLYYYFNDKEEIFTQIIEKEAQRYIQILESSISADCQIKENIKQYTLVRLQYFKALSERFSALKSELLSFLPLIETIRKPYHQKEIELVYGLIFCPQSTQSQESLFKKAEVIVSINKALEIPLFVNTEFAASSTNTTFDVEAYLDLILDGIS